jgi:glutathione synthase/RimK-type ligase-like ATP-grasp enzyme
MILLWGLLEDSTFESVYGCLKRRGADVAFVNHAAIARCRMRMDCGSDTRYRLSCDEFGYDLRAVSAAYLRPYNHRHYEKQRDPDVTVSRADLVHHLVGIWAESSDAIIVNRRSAEATNHSKLDQARAIRASGFLVPDSLVTNNPDLASDFLSRHGSVVYKSMSSVRSVVRELKASALDAIDRLGPVFFQQRINGQNIRVHVIGERTVACRIRATGVDYRYAPASIEPMALGEDVASRCVALTAQLGLRLSGIDLIWDGNDYYCLEVNPNPAFSCFEEPPDNSIAQAVAELLMQASPAASGRMA